MSEFANCDNPYSTWWYQGMIETRELETGAALMAVSLRLYRYLFRESMK